MKKFDFAIVIPTLNEEKFIGILLDSLASQSLQPRELVIVDAYSKDKTIEQIKKRQKFFPQLKIYQIEKSTISRQRNFGASKTKSGHTLFLDADALLKDPKTLEKYFKELEKSQPDIAVCYNLPLSSYWKNKIYFVLMNQVITIAKKHWPVAPAINMYVKRNTFERVGGFDEAVRVGEDVELIQKIVKNGGKFEILKTPKVYTSTRRMDEEGRRKYTLKLLKGFFYIRKHGFKNNPIEYELGKH